MREGKYMGAGRTLLPPMPWQVYGMKTDEDLKVIYAYLMSIKPIKNMGRSQYRRIRAGKF